MLRGRPVHRAQDLDVADGVGSRRRGEVAHTTADEYIAGAIVEDKQMLLRVLVVVAAVGAVSSDAGAMSLKFSWAGYRACSTRSPAFTLSDVPTETAQLAFRMIDREVPTYPHGGGTVPYHGKGEIPAGAFSYKGPCPPSGQQHAYEWTVQALDRNGKAIGSATAAEKFPSR